MKINFIRFFARFLLLLFLGIMVLMFAGCRTKKSTVDRSTEKVSELRQNDIETSENKVTTSNTLRLSDSREWSFEPVDPSEPSRVISGEDTTDFYNTRIVVKKDRVKESGSETSEVEKSERDKSSSESVSEKEEKHKNKNVKSASWGLNLGIIGGIIIFVAIWLFKNKLRFPL